MGVVIRIVSNLAGNHKKQMTRGRLRVLESRSKLASVT